MSEIVNFVARTAAGDLIRTFGDRDLALSWSDVDGERDFPGHTISVEITRTIVTARVIKRHHERKVA